MSFGTLASVFSKIAIQTIEPLGAGSGFGSMIGWFFTWLWQSICLGIYNMVRWLLALVDFMQYFVQKLIGLDYWLNRSYYTLEGAIESDIIFGFLYSDTVQQVFRAMVGIFFVLLIIFTIYAIVKQEWTYITGKEFGNGSGNSKSKILKDSLKAIALVLIFPIILMIGIISANAILASLIKALNIDTSSTLGGTLFQIASQDAVKYEKYAHGENGRTAVADQVTFYIKDDKWVRLSKTDEPSGLTINCPTYSGYLKNIIGATKYTVNAVFDKVDPGFDMGEGVGGRNFTGYCAKLSREGEPFFVMVNAAGKEDAYRYYLKNVLQVPVVTSNDDVGFPQAADFIDDGYIDSNGLIKNFPLWKVAGLGGEEKTAIARACYNTWNYASIYQQMFAFEEAEDYVTVRSSEKVGKSGNQITGGNDTGLFTALGLSGVSSAKVMYNSDLISQYFDGGQQGVVQMQSEYLVMSEIVNFMCANNLRLYMLDMTSSLIDWAGVGDYSVDSRWIGKTTPSQYVEIPGYGKGIPFVINYNDNCNETEMSNVLYFGASGVSKSSELDGAKYIMCLKVEGQNNAKYIPLVNNKTFTDPTTGQKINFKSDYYASNYRGVVLAKGILDADATNAEIGEPTYLVSGAYTNQYEKDVEADDLELVAEDQQYYYDMKIAGGFNQFATDAGTDTETLTIQDVSISLQDDKVSYRADLNDAAKSSYKITKITQQDEGDPDEKEISPSDDIIRNMQVKFEKGGDVFVANYAGYSASGHYLFVTDYNAEGFYFIVGVDKDGVVSIYSYESNVWVVATQASGVTHLTKRYYIKYDYVQGGTEKYAQNINSSDSTYSVTPTFFEYVKQVNGKSLFSTVDMQNIDALGKTLYISIVFDTSSQSLVSINYDKDTKQASLSFVAPRAVPASYSERAADPYIQSSNFVRFYLYNFYTANVNGTFREYDVKNSGFKAGAVAEPTDEEWWFECKMDVSNFSFPAQESYLHLYDGKKYVATIYKVAGNDGSLKVNSPSELPSKSTYILYDNHYYYNIDTQNYYANETDAGNYYKGVVGSMVVTCTRDNRDYVFMDSDFSFTGLIPFKMRLYFHFFHNELERGWQGHQFYLHEGIHFDYFFEGEASLRTFYIPSEISYWIIVIASALMIKVLGTAIWGVIKRIYEITLYFIAMPAVASIIPIDPNKFTTSIQQPLTKKILSTYGVMLGINVFFILLYPVKSLSQIFTAEDIATSNSYFLKNFFSMFSYEFKADVLNLYVYILFVLVAFTMISALPSVIAGMIGAEDVYGTGKATKDAAMKDVKSAMDFASGKSAMDAGKRMIGQAKEGGMLPGGALAKGAWGLGKKGVGAIRDKFNKGDGSEEEKGDEKPKTSNRNGEELTDEEAQVENAIDSKVQEATGGMTYAEAMASGDKDKIEAAEAAKAAVETDIAANGTDAQKQALTTYNAKMEKATEKVEGETPEGETPEGETEEAPKSPEEAIESAAKEQFEGNMGEIAGSIGGADATAMQGNVVRNAYAQGDKTAQQVATAVITSGGKTIQQGLIGNNDEGKVDGTGALNMDAIIELIKSILSGEQKEQFEAQVAEAGGDEAKLQELIGGFNIQTKQTADGIGFSIGQMVKGEDGTEKMQWTEASAEASNAAVASVLTDDKVDATLGAQGNEGMKAGIAQAAASNIALAIDMSADADKDDSVVAALQAGVMANAGDPENAAIINKAMLEAIKADPSKLAALQQMEGLTDDQMGNDALLLARIGSLRGNGTTISQLGLNQDDYAGNVGAAIKEGVQNGTFAVSAWDAYKAKTPNAAQEYMDGVAKDNLLRNSDEAAYEAEESKKIVEDAQNKNDLIFNAFASGAGAGDMATIQGMFSAYLGMDPAKINQITSGLDQNLVNGLIQNGVNGQAVSQEQIALAAKAIELTGKTVDEASLTAFLTASQNGDNATELLDLMKSGKGGDLESAKEALTSGTLLDEEQLTALSDSVAAQGMLGLDEQQQAGVKDMLAKTKFGGKTYSELGEDERKAIDEEANSLSAYEMSQMFKFEEGGKVKKLKTREDVFDTLQHETKKKQMVEAIIADGDIDESAALSMLEDGSPEAQAFIEAYANQMNVVSDDRKAQIAKEAEEKAILAHFGIMKKDAGTPDALIEKVKEIEGPNSTFDADLESEKRSQLLARYQKDRKFQHAKNEWLKNNKGKNESDFAAAVLAGDVKADGIFDEKADATKLQDDIKSINSKAFKEKFAVSRAKNALSGNAGLEAEIATTTQQAIADENMMLLANGAGEEVMKIAAGIRTDSSRMKKARKRYQEIYGDDQDFDKADELAQATFLAMYMATDDEKKNLTKIKPLSKDKAAVNAGIMSSLRDNPEMLSQVYSYMGSFDGGSEANSAIENLKRAYVESQADELVKTKKKGKNDYGGLESLDYAKDPDKMGAEERKRFDFNKGVLQQEMRSNPDVIGNIFKNSNILGQDAMIAEIAKAQGIKKNDKGEYIGSDGKVITGADGKAVTELKDLKAHLDNEQIARYMDAHENTKDRLVNIGAQDMTKAIDSQTLELRKASAVLDNPELGGKVADKVLEKMLALPGGGKVDENEIKALISKMLEMDPDRKDKANDEAFINANLGALKAELAIRGVTYKGDVGDGTHFDINTQVSNQTAFTDAMKELEKTDTAFSELMKKGVTQILDPSTYDPENGSPDFFKAHTMDGFKAGAPKNMAEAIAQFQAGKMGGAADDDKKENKGDVLITGGPKSGLKALLFGTAKENLHNADGTKRKFGGVLGNERERGGLLGGLESLVVKGASGSIVKAVTFKSVRKAVGLVKGYKAYKRTGDNMGFKSYLRQKAGIEEFKRDDKGNIIKENGKAVRLKKGDAGYQGKWTRFKKYAGKAMDNTAIGSLIGHTALGVSKIAAGTGLALLKTTGGSFRDSKGHFKKKSAVKGGIWGGAIALSAFVPVAAPLVATAVGAKVAYKAGKTFLNKTKIGNRVKNGLSKEFLNEDGKFRAKGIIKAGALGAATIFGGVPLVAASVGAFKLGKKFLNETYAGQRFRNGLGSVGGFIARNNFITRTGMNAVVRGYFAKDESGKRHIWKGIGKSTLSLGKSFITENAIARGIARNFRNNKTGRYTPASVILGTLRAAPLAVAGIVGGPVTAAVAGAVATTGAGFAGKNGVVFKITKTLPQRCSQYENWNRVLNAKIDDIKKSKTLTREQKEVEIRKLESQRIYVDKKPEFYSSFNPEQKNEFDAMQEKLKRDAFLDPNLVRYVRNIQNPVHRGENPSAYGIKGSFRALDPTVDSRHRHLDTYKQVQAMLNRYNATAAMRDPMRDFGNRERFERLAKSFLTRSAYKDMMLRLKLKKIDEEHFTTKQLAKLREKALVDQLNKLNRIVSRKIAIDNKQHPQQYLVSRGVMTEEMRYSDGSRRFRTTQSGLTGTGLVSRENSQSRTTADIMRMQNEAVQLDKMMHELIAKNAGFKDSPAEYRRMLEQIFAGRKDLIDKIYNKYASSLKRIGGAALGRSASLESSPVAVQQREVMKGLVEEMKKYQKRVTGNGMIPASAAMNALYTGKTLTGATTKAEVALIKKQAEEFDRLLKMIQSQKDSVSFASLTKRVSTAVMEEFNRKHKFIASKSEAEKKAALERFISRQLDAALKRAHNTTMFKSDISTLTSLNGRYVKKSELQRAGRSTTMAEAARTSNSPVYNSIVREFNSASEKVKLENVNLSLLAQKLRQLTAMPRTPQNASEIAAINKAISKSKLNLDRLSRLLSAAEAKKKDFERSFASTQIKEAKVGNRSLAYNAAHSKVVERYVFPKADGTVVAQGTVEAKQVERLVSNYIQQYRQQIQAMLKSSIMSTERKLGTKIQAASRKFSDDFGKTMAQNRELRETLLARIAELKGKTDEQSKRTRRELQDSIKKLEQSEKELETRMRGMGINVKAIGLKK